jgi:DNA polymerase-3 subunit gamma/tau
MRQALYRSYRPKSFDEVVGQEHITTVLKNEMAADTPSHAYLLVGARGTGKTSCAKLIAKAVNCPERQGANPCGACDICRGVDDASLLDVVEIDAASNNGVDNIRDLRDEAVFTPAVAKYRVYIIDEVHMLSPSAFNALLKILEEPPAHVIFVLATTEIHKVPATIISRCQRFDFRRIESAVIAARLQVVADSEGISLSDDAGALIARLSEGGLRDALSLLDVCAASQQPITADQVAKSAGLAGFEHLFGLTQRILDADAPGALETLGALITQSLEPQRLCEQLIRHYRNLMMAKMVKQPEEIIDCLPSEAARLREQSWGIALPDLLHSLKVLQDAAARMGKSVIKRAELELAVVSLAEPSVRTGQQSLLSRIERLEAAGRRGCGPAAAQTQGQAEPAPPDGGPIEPADPRQDPPEGRTGAPQPFAPWPQVLEQLSAQNGSVAGLLINTRAYFDGRRILIDVQNPALLALLKQNDYTRNCIKQAVAAVTGRHYGIGPYRPGSGERENRVDPLERLVSSLPESDRFTVE